MNCYACGGLINSMNHMNCSKCDKVYDLACINLTENNYNNMSQEYKSTWLCPNCTCSRPKGDNSFTPIRPPTGSVTDDNNGLYANVSMTRGSKPKGNANKDCTQCQKCDVSLLVAEIRQLRQEICDLRSQNNEISLLRQEYSELKQLLTASSGEIHSAFSSKVDTSLIEIADLKLSVSELKLKLNTQEQNAMKNELELIGIPEADKEDLNQLVMSTAQELGLQLNHSDIDDITRIGFKRPRRSSAQDNHKPRPIVVKLLKRQKKEEILRAAKAKKNLSTENIVKGSNGKLFINERLTKSNRLLFREARSWASSNFFRYCWSKNGGIYVRENDNKPAIRIFTTADLGKCSPQIQSVTVSA